ncbi:MAG: APC family permease [Gammaproteobacteria bacterium]|nr:APC family permease [Gammaproteobacteria bacterium]
MSIIAKLKRYVIGAPLNPFNPNVFRHVSLVALLAWVGLGADGLSSSCYGPEEAYIALGAHNTHLALFIALAMAITVFIISLGYNQVIELFPSGGGGYKVATELLGSYVGLVSGAALLIDYVLTITVSAASGMDAFFSLLPHSYLSYKFMSEGILILFLMTLNCRGMKESIKFLLPIFLGFFILHVGLIIYGIAAHSKGLLTIIPETLEETKYLSSTIGWLPLLALMLHAYSLGSGTYTGLEAVSNNVNRLAEPRVRTGKWTMFYMAVSLSFTASGIILLYLLWQATPHAGLTLNAVVFHSILGDSLTGKITLIATLALEAGLLFVAANTGFLGGPSVLSNMAIDGWVPNRFRYLSSRLVVQNGVIIFGLLALLLLYWSHGRVSLLVILYSINVFITFSLSLLGLCVYWIKQRNNASRNWLFRLLFSFFTFVITSSILCITLFSKFRSGGWVTILITCAVISICLLIKRHYLAIERKSVLLDKELYQPILEKNIPSIPIDPSLPTAVILVGKSTGIGMHTLLSIIRLFPRHFKNFIFVRVGIVDVGSYTEQSKLQKMKQDVPATLQYFVDYCHQYGIAAKYYVGFGTDIIQEINKISEKIDKEFPNCIFFSSKLVFIHDNWITRLLHHETALTIQRSLHLQGKEMVVLPMKI